MNRVKKQFVSDEGVLLVDAGLLGDDLHLTEKGHRVLIAILVETHLNKLISSAKEIIETKENE